MSTQTLVAWTEITVKDLDASARFYDEVFKWTTKVDRSTPRAGATLNGEMMAGGADLVEGPGGSQTITHLTLPDSLEAGMARLEAAGGKVLSPIVDVPPGRFVIAHDLDQNAIGLFEPKAA